MIMGAVVGGMHSVFAWRHLRDISISAARLLHDPKVFHVFVSCKYLMYSRFKPAAASLSKRDAADNESMYQHILHVHIFNKEMTLSAEM